MLIRCKFDKEISLPKDCKPASNDLTYDTGLVVNQEYVVYTMTIRSNYVWYYLCTWGIEYPVWHASPLFEVVDGSLSKYWIYSFIWEKEINYVDTTWAYPEWANDPNNYYHRLTDGYDWETKIFAEYKQLMDVEFPIPSVKDTAKLIDDDWLMCDYCIDAWESSTSNQAMVICPTCQRMMHNPRFKPKPDFLEEWKIHER